MADRIPATGPVYTAAVLEQLAKNYAHLCNLGENNGLARRFRAVTI